MPRRSGFSVWNILGALCAVAICAAAVGCGSNEGPERFDLSGSVQFAGKPVPMGSIEFVPDPDAENSGPAAYADIVDGRYTTNAGKGIVGGAYVLTVVGYDGVATVDASEGANPRGTPLFPPHEMRTDLPAGAGTFDVVIPAAPGSADEK